MTLGGLPPVHHCAPLRHARQVHRRVEDGRQVELTRQHVGQQFMQPSSTPPSVTAKCCIPKLKKQIAKQDIEYA